MTASDRLNEIEDNCKLKFEYLCDGGDSMRYAICDGPVAMQCLHTQIKNPNCQNCNVLGKDSYLHYTRINILVTRKKTPFSSAQQPKQVIFTHIPM